MLSVFVLCATGICEGCQSSCVREAMVTVQHHPWVNCARCPDLWLAFYPKPDNAPLASKCRVSEQHTLPFSPKIGISVSNIRG